MKMKWLTWIAVLSVSGWLPSTELQAEETALKAVKSQTICPVMKGKIDKQLFVDHAGKRIYVCCAGCIPAVKKDPAKYIRDMEAAGITPAPVPDKAAKPAENKK